MTNLKLTNKIFLLIYFLIGMNFFCASHVSKSSHKSADQNNNYHKWYMDSVSDALNNCFELKWGSKLDTSLNNEIEFTVRKNGDISNCKIIKSSKLPAFDSVALDCVKELKCNPLPAKFNGDSIEGRIQFGNNGKQIK